MLERELLNPANFPDSPYAQELGGGVARLRFGPELEQRYRQVHLQRMRLRVRLWFSFSALVALADIVLRLLGHDRHNPVGWSYGIADVCDLLLVWLAWSPLYRRWYLRVAPLLLPLLGAACAVFIAHALVIGQGEQLAVLTVSVMVFFFFAGLLFRTALIATAALIAAFAATLLSFGPPNLAEAASLAMLLVTAVICAIGYRDIERSYRRGFLENALVAELVTRDELSGLLNRRAFHEHLQRVWQQAQRERCPLGVVMIDIDHFKSYNDSYGHQAGDAALRSVAQLLKGFARRPLDLAARYGGDEFVAVLYDLQPTQVGEIAERIRQTVQDYHLQQQLLLTAALDGAGGEARAADAQPPAAAARGVTVSIGIGVIVPPHGRSEHGAVQLADEALYEAKQAGRNCVVIKGAEHYARLDTGSFRRSRAG